MRFTDFSPLSADLVDVPSPLTSLQREAVCPSVRRVSRAALPPRGFKLIQGTPSSVRFGGEVPHNRGRTHAQKAGLRYEQKVQDILCAIYGTQYRAAPSILYEDRSGLRRAIPDGLLDLGSRLVVVEIKLTHCEKAWWQLNRLYFPLLQQLSPTRIELCEICRSFDPDVVWPVDPSVVESLHQLPVLGTGVLTWTL